MTCAFGLPGCMALAACIAFAISAGLLAVIVGGGIADARGRPRRRAGGRESGAEKSKVVWLGWVAVAVMAKSGFEKYMGGHQGIAMHTACALLYPDPKSSSIEKKQKCELLESSPASEPAQGVQGDAIRHNHPRLFAEGRSVRCGLAV